MADVTLKLLVLKTHDVDAVGHFVPPVRLRKASRHNGSNLLGELVLDAPLPPPLPGELPR